MTARRVLLSTGELELLRRSALPPPLALPPGFRVAPSSGSCPVRVDAALGEVLRRVAAPEVAVVVAAAAGGLEVTACVGLAGAHGAALLRTGDTAVELSDFAADHLRDELARLVPAADERVDRRPRAVPLADLLDPRRPPLAVLGTLVATVVAAGVGPVGRAAWVLAPEGWVALEAVADRGDPTARLVPVAPADLGAWLAPHLALAVAGAAG